MTADVLLYLVVLQLQMAWKICPLTAADSGSMALKNTITINNNDVKEKSIKLYLW